MTGAIQLQVQWIHSGADGQDHALTLKDVVDNFRQRGQTCPALCDYRLPGDAVGAATGNRCPSCVRFVAARESLFVVEDRFLLPRQRRPAFVSRLLGRSRAPRHAASA